jgi:phosphate/sulfate permease
LRIALVMAALLNFVCACIEVVTGAKVSSSIQDVVPNIANGDPTLALIVGGLIGAILSSLMTWYFGTPCSSTHALISAIAGSAIIEVYMGTAKDQVDWSIVVGEAGYQSHRFSSVRQRCLVHDGHRRGSA